MADPRIKNLKIKTGVVHRLNKEKISYEKEVEQTVQKIEKLKEQGEDEHVLKKWNQVLQESRAMIPDCHRRLVVAYGDLNNVLDTEKDLEESAEYTAAKEKLAEVAKAQDL